MSAKQTNINTAFMLTAEQKARLDLIPNKSRWIRSLLDRELKRLAKLSKKAAGVAK